MILRILLVCGMLVCASLSAVLLKKDEALNSTASGYLEQLQQDKSSQAFMYYKAISVPEDQDPAEVGNAMYANSAGFHKTAIVDTTSTKLPLPSGPLFCTIHKDDSCINTLFTHKQDVNIIKIEHKELLSRNEHFLSFNEYSTLTKPNYDIEFPEYSYFARAERIRMLEAIDYHKKGQSTEAVNLLYSRIEKSRNMFRHQDSLVGKLLFLAILSNQVDVASIILSESGLTAKPIHPLSTEERDFSDVAALEFGYAYASTIKAVENHGNSEENSSVVNELLTKALKINMTINATTPMYIRLEELAALNFMDFSQEMSKPPTQLKTSMFWNPVGFLFLSVTEVSSFDKYLTRMFDFNAKLVLFNHRYHKNLDFKDASNPYFENELSEVHSNEVCFRSFNEQRRSSCLQTAIEPDQLATVDD